MEPARRSVMAVLEREEVEAHSSICHRYCPRLSHQNRRESSGDSEVLAASPSRCSASSLPSAAAVAAAEASALSPPLWALEVLVGAAPHASALLAVAWVHHPHSNRRRRRRRRRASAWPLVVQVVLAVRRELPVVPPELPLEGVTQELARGNRRRRRRRCHRRIVNHVAAPVVEQGRELGPAVLLPVLPKYAACLCWPEHRQAHRQKKLHKMASWTVLPPPPRRRHHHPKGFRIARWVHVWKEQHSARC